MAKFEVGKKVICIKTHSGNKFKKGEVYTLLAKKKGCKDIKLVLDIGIEAVRTRCPNCGKVLGEGSLWADSASFLPYDDSLSEFTSENILDCLEISEIDSTFAVSIKN